MVCDVYVHLLKVRFRASLKIDAAYQYSKKNQQHVNVTDHSNAMGQYEISIHLLDRHLLVSELVGVAFLLPGHGFK